MNQIQDKVRNAFKQEKRCFMAREELNSQAIIINEWQHQSILPMYFAVMMSLLTASWQEILEESVKQILNAIPNKHLVDYNEKATLIDYRQTSNCSYNSFSNNLVKRKKQLLRKRCSLKKHFFQ